MISRSDAYHTTHPCSEALWRTADALCACVQEPDHNVAGHLLKALARLALEACAAPPDDAGHSLAETLFHNMHAGSKTTTRTTSTRGCRRSLPCHACYVSRLFHRLSGSRHGSVDPSAYRVCQDAAGGNEFEGVSGCPTVRLPESRLLRETVPQALRDLSRALPMRTPARTAKDPPSQNGCKGEHTHDQGTFWQVIDDREMHQLDDAASTF